MRLAKLALVAILAIPLSGCVFSLGGGCSKSVHDRRLERIERRLDRIEGKLDIPPVRVELEEPAELQ